MNTRNMAKCKKRVAEGQIVRNFYSDGTKKPIGRGTTTGALMSDRGRGRGTTTSVISDRGRGRGTTTGSLLSVCHGWGFAGLGHSWAKVVTQL